MYANYVCILWIMQVLNYANDGYMLAEMAHVWVKSHI